MAIVRSGAWPVMVTLALSFAATGSVSFSAVLVAVFVTDGVEVNVNVGMGVNVLVDVAVFGHGNPIRERASEAFRRSLARLR